MQQNSRWEFKVLNDIINIVTFNKPLKDIITKLKNNHKYSKKTAVPLFGDDHMIIVQLMK